MTQKATDNSAGGCLILIFPIALLIIFLFATWPVLLALVVLSAIWNVWQQYQWQKWSQQVNPIFHQLIQQNRGSITALDLAMKAGFSAQTAKRYLDIKAEEFGAQRQDYEDQGTLYYFITASTLGSIFDESEPPSKPNREDVLPRPSLSPQELLESRIGPSRDAIHPSLEDAQHTSLTDDDSSSQEEQAEPPNHQQPPPKSLIQSELAKRLDVHSSTVYKRRDDPDFAEWSRSRDPDGIAWKFLPDTKLFSPLEEESS